MNDDINKYVPSVLNPRTVPKSGLNLSFLSQNSVVSRCSLSLKKNKHFNKFQYKQSEFDRNKENLNTQNTNVNKSPKKYSKKTIDETDYSVGFSAIEDLCDDKSKKKLLSLSSCTAPFIPVIRQGNYSNFDNCEGSLICVSSDTDLNDEKSFKSENTLLYNLSEQKPIISVEIGLKDCNKVELSTTNVNLNKITITNNNNNYLLECDLLEASELPSDVSECNEAMDYKEGAAVKRLGATVNLEFKKKKVVTESVTGNEKVLFLNTDAVDKLSHVIVQPPNYKLVKKRVLDTNKFKSSTQKGAVSKSSWNKSHGNLKQKTIDSYLKNTKAVTESGSKECIEKCYKQEQNVVLKVQEMSKNTKSPGNNLVFDNGIHKKEAHSARANMQQSQNERVKQNERDSMSPRKRSTNKLDTARRRHENIKSASDAYSRTSRNNFYPNSGKKNMETTQFSLATGSKTNQGIPFHKLVVGTNFAVDAFSYGDIPNVKHYFLTHFHSDHYAGLKKSFNKLLYCDKITADLCTSRLGVNSNCITILKIDETIKIDDVEITALDANHCPGAVMLVFTLANGKTILHTGDFRASYVMESYPMFWNKDIHTVYLDTTYCNPRYDFPTQDQSLEMALFLLRQKKMDLEKVGKKFSSVLIVCGTYTIGKEKFFLGMARRIGCNVWACPEKDRVLQLVEGRSFSGAPPQSCQLHVVSMRELTVERLRSYLSGLSGTFDQVVAFKPSGWENGKNSTIVEEKITIHGIPYSEHSSFSEMIRFVKFLQPKQVVPTVDISGGIKAVQKFFPCPLLCKEESQSQSRVTDYFAIQNRPSICC